MKTGKRLHRFSAAETSVLIGSMFGDGTIVHHHNNKNAVIFEEAHCWKQRTWSLWKANFLHKLEPVIRHIKRKEINTSDQLRLITRDQKLLMPIRESFYRPHSNGNMMHKHYWDDLYINMLGHLGVLVHYLDDGYRQYERSYYITCQAISDDSRNRYRDYLQDLAGGLPVTIRPRGEIYFPAKTRNYILPIWRKLFDKYNMPEAMRYKIS